MTILELISAVREERLSKEQLEDYSTQLSNLFASMKIEQADLEKKEAMFMATHKNPQNSVAEVKVNWKSTHEGQRLIEIKNYGIATKELINSCKSRIYKLIY